MGFSLCVPSFACVSAIPFMVMPIWAFILCMRIMWVNPLNEELQNDEEDDEEFEPSKAINAEDHVKKINVKKIMIISTNT